MGEVRDPGWIDEGIRVPVWRRAFDHHLREGKINQSINHKALMSDEKVSLLLTVPVPEDLKIWEYSISSQYY